MHSRIRVKGTAFFDSTTTINNLVVGGTNVGTALSNLPSGPVMVRNTVHMQPGSWENWPVLPNDLSVLVHDSNSTSRYQLPLIVADGYRFKIMACAGSGLGTINIHCGLSSGRQFHANSAGGGSTIQRDFNSVGTDSWDVVYISAINKWLVV